mgnify:CR=1 FL=1
MTNVAMLTNFERLREIIKTRKPERLEAFDAYIESNGYLDSNRGSVAKRNAVTSPWVHQFDVRISQEIPLFRETRGEVFLDILNISNLINDEWGHIDQAPFPYQLQVARFAGVNGSRYV